MKTLLPAIQTTLQTMSQLERRSDCYLTPHANYMPTGTRQPCIGIKDAGTIRQELAGEVLELKARVELVGFVKMTGDGSACLCGTDGVFQLLDDAAGLLRNNHLSLTDVQRVEIGPDRPSELFRAENNQWIVKLSRTMIYTLERSSV